MITNAEKTRLLLVDDHRILREGLRSVLNHEHDLEVVGEAGDGASALTLIAREHPDIVILDIHLGVENALTWVEAMLHESPGTKIVILSAEADHALVEKALHLGAVAYVIKSDTTEELLRAIRHARQGHLYLCPHVMTTVLQHKAAPPPQAPAANHLNERERDLVRLVAQGLRNKEIAEHLGLSPKSVETYRGRIMKRLGCDSPAELVRWAIRHQLVTA